MECRSKLVAIGEWTLRAGPDGEFAIGPLRHGRARFERSMRDIRNGVRSV